MKQGVNVKDDEPHNTDAPFEWLTNFQSLRHLVFPSRIVFGSEQEDDASESNNSDRIGIETSSSSSTASLGQQPIVQLNSLHVGCGTSILGESLLLLRERTRNHLLHYGHVINVDNDKRALDSMQQRWENRKPQQTNQHEQMGTMEWKYLDFKREETCRLALDGVYRQLMQNHAGEPGGCIDLVLDKSTLDCLLCAETSNVAQFLCEVYRALRVPTSSESNPSGDSSEQVPSWGGVYVLVSFHPAEFVERLLTQLPGADWQVEHEVIKREVEDLKENRVCTVDEVNCYSDKSHAGIKKDMLSPSSSAWSSGTFHPDENYRRTVTVFTCRRCLSRSNNGEVSPQPTYILDPEQVRQHIERTCDEWYQTTNPMVTSEREEQICMAFLEAAAAKMNVKDDDPEGRELPSADITFDLRQCYDVLFTDAEKEHLDYEYFLEDWGAYCEQKMHNNENHQGGMTVAIALDFLKEMQ